MTLDKEDEVCILYGTKNGLVALPTCVVNPGENVLLPDPGYTDYLAGSDACRCQSCSIKFRSSRLFAKLGYGIREYSRQHNACLFNVSQ